MVLPFFTDKRETPVSIRRKAEDLLARAEDISKAAKGRPLLGEMRLQRTGMEGDFRQFRDYRDGDRPQDIDWKRSARSDATLVREREKNQHLAIGLHIQNNPGMHFGSSGLPTKYEAAGIIGTAFALWAARHHNPVYFCGERTDKDHLPSAVLAQKKQPNPSVRKNSVTVLLGDYIEPVEALQAQFSSLSAHHVILLQIFDPAELDLPWHGRYVFENSAVKSLVNDSDGIRRDYQSALRAHNEALKAYCRKRNWHYALARTDQDMANVFSAALASIGDRR